MTGMSRKQGVLVVLVVGMVLGWMVLQTGRGPFDGSRVRDSADCGQFLLELGWETDLSRAESKETVLPEEFNDVYGRYNDLQKQQGCDLYPYRGKVVTVYTLPVVGYEAQGTVYATVLVHEGKVIGGDVHSGELGGWMGSLIRNEP